MQEIVVDSARLHDFARTLCEKVGLRSEDADTVARHQVLTDLRGVHSHGTRALPGYLNLVLDGKMNAQPDLRIATEGPSFAVIDGGNGIGHLASTLAMETAITKAKVTGIAAAAVRNAGHFGAAACYAIMAASHQMVGFSTTNTGGASIVAPGGAEAVVANNAMSYALPTGDEHHPIVLDMACGVSAWGKIGTLRMYGKPIPEGWLIDETGQPTNDPEKGRFLAPAAGPRGYGLALIMGILAGPLSGGLMACHKTDDPSEHFFFALNVASFTDYEAYVEEVQHGIQKIHASKTAEGVEQAYLPGEIEWNNYDNYRENGIPIHVDHLRGLAGIAEKLGVSICWEW